MTVATMGVGLLKALSGSFGRLQKKGVPPSAQFPVKEEGLGILTDPAVIPSPKDPRTHTPGPLHAQLVVSWGEAQVGADECTFCGVGQSLLCRGLQPTSGATSSPTQQPQFSLVPVLATHPCLPLPFLLGPRLTRLLG